MNERESGSGTEVCIIGLGLMGGSLALALSRRGIAVTGWDENPAALREASLIGAIRSAPESFAQAVRRAAVIFIATPVTEIVNSVRRALPETLPGAIFSDLGSIKEAFVEEIFAFLPADRFFVPGHPMTGSEEHGIAAADPFLFENAAYILIEDPRTPPEALRRIRDLVQGTGASLLTLSAAAHDRIVAAVSHLPHLIAATLAKTAGAAEEDAPGTLALAAGGFRDTTRVATGSPDLWTGIILGNRGKVLDVIEAFQVQLDALRNLLLQNDTAGLCDFLGKGREVRLQIPAKNKGFLTLLHEMVVTIADQPGTIDAVLRHLAREGLNIKDIEILRVREGDGGTLRLAFENGPAVDQAVMALAREGFKVRKR